LPDKNILIEPQADYFDERGADVQLEFQEYRPRKLVNVHRHVDGPWFWPKYSAHPLAPDIIACGDWQQPAEDRHRLSRGMLEVVRDLSFPLFIVERSPLVTRDADLLIEINHRAWVGAVFSLTTGRRASPDFIASKARRVCKAAGRRQKYSC